MKNMKRILFTVLALSFLGFVFTSCERDWIYPSDDDIQEAILGTWKVLDVSGVEITDNATRVTFYDNGRARYSASAYDKGYWIDTTVVFHLNNHIITFDGVPAEILPDARPDIEVWKHRSLHAPVRRRTADEGSVNVSVQTGVGAEQHPDDGDQHHHGEEMRDIADILRDLLELRVLDGVEEQCEDDGQREACKDRIERNGQGVPQHFLELQY